MRFLLFNLVVSAALVYLLLGEHPTAVIDGVVGEVRDRVAAASDTTERLIDSGAAIDGSAQTGDVQPTPWADTVEEAPARIDEFISLTSQTHPRIEPEPEETDVDSSSPSGVVERYPLAAVAHEPIPFPSTSVWPSEQPLIPVDDPAVIRRRAEVLGIVASGDETPGADTSVFMSPSERQRELHALAEEMELLFANELTR